MVLSYLYGHHEEERQVKEEVQVVVHTPIDPCNAPVKMRLRRLLLVLRSII